VERTHFYAEVPALHVAINAFLGHLQSLLDTLVQLLGTQKIVNHNVHGFHKKKRVIGGEVLNVLANNARAEVKETAQRLSELIVRGKSEWIDSFDSAPAHPKKPYECALFFILGSRAKHVL
jgi:hypothetical protein